MYNIILQKKELAEKKSTLENKIIFLLIGAKGSGKTFIGIIIESHFNIKFIRVEDWVKEIKKDRQIEDEKYLRDAFQVIETGIRSFLNNYSKIVFESTGLTNYFDQMIKSLRKDFKVITIKIQAESALCLERVKNRDLSIHINISDDQVININKQVQAKNMKTDFILSNNDKHIYELKAEIENIIKHYN